jgi:hypothetical protein
MTEDFDLETVYDEKIAPLMTEIIKICRANRLPMLATFQYSKEDFCTTFMPFEDRTDDSIKLAAKIIEDGYAAFIVKRR